MVSVARAGRAVGRGCSADWRSLRDFARRHEGRTEGAIEAEDVAQDALVAAMCAGRVGDGPWIRGTIRHLWAGDRRRRERRAVPPRSVDVQETDVATDNLHTTMEEFMDLREALAHLEVNQQHELVLFAVAGYSLGELASIADCSVSCMKKRLERTRRQLRSMLEERHRDNLGHSAQELGAELFEVLDEAITLAGSRACRRES